MERQISRIPLASRFANTTAVFPIVKEGGFLWASVTHGAG